MRSRTGRGRIRDGPGVNSLVWSDSWVRTKRVGTVHFRVNGEPAHHWTGPRSNPVHDHGLVQDELNRPVHFNSLRLTMSDHVSFGLWRTSISRGPYRNSKWRTSISRGPHRNSKWRTSISRGPQRFYKESKTTFSDQKTTPLSTRWPLCHGLSIFVQKNVL
jgi:hypothetical protein